MVTKSQRCHAGLDRARCNGRSRTNASGTSHRETPGVRRPPFSCRLTGLLPYLPSAAIPSCRATVHGSALNALPALWTANGNVPDTLGIALIAAEPQPDGPASAGRPRPAGARWLWVIRLGCGGNNDIFGLRLPRPGAAYSRWFRGANTAQRQRHKHCLTSLACRSDGPDGDGTGERIYVD